MNISRVIYWAERRYGDSTAVIHQDDEISYRDMRENTEKYIHYFSILGLDRKKPIIVSLPNIPEFIYITMSLNSLGIPIILTNISISVPELSYIITDSGAETLISYTISDEFMQRVCAATCKNVSFIDIKKPSNICSDYSFGEFINNLKPMRVFNPIPDPLSTLIIYTSGEGGFLKGASLSYSNLMSNILITREFIHLKPDDICLSLLPFYHAYGFANTLLSGLLEGVKLLLIDRYRIAQIFEFIEKYRVTRVQSVPMMFYTLFRHRQVDKFDLSSLRACVSGGSRMDIEFQKFVKDRFNIEIRQGFGITEASAAVTFNFFHDDIVYGSCGKLLPIFLSKLVDDEGNTAGKNGVGELYIKGPSVTDRYIGRFADCRDKFTKDGWFKTGDYFMVDEKGNHFFKGLKKEMYLVGGYNVYPREVERIIGQIEDISSVSLFSDGTDAKGNYIISAKITIRDMDKKNDIYKEICSSLSPYKVPSRIEWIEAE